MNKKTILIRLFLKYFKDLPFLALNLSKPRIAKENIIDKIKLKNFHFQYAFEMKSVNQDFIYPRYENILVANHILKEINKSGIKANEIQSLCESAPLDGYIIWRLSQLEKKAKLNLNILEIQAGNCEKISLISEVFDYKVNVFNDSLDTFNKMKFSYFTMLGVTYQLPNPIITFTHIINNLLLPGAIFYFDFIHPYDNFNKFGFHDNGTIEMDGFNGTKYILADNRSKEENGYYLNHPTSAVSTILFKKSAFKNIFNSKFNLELKELYTSVSTTYEMVTYVVYL
jgi:hypothetical protein